PNAGAENHADQQDGLDVDGGGKEKRTDEGRNCVTYIESSRNQLISGATAHLEESRYLCVVSNTKRIEEVGPDANGDIACGRVGGQPGNGDCHDPRRHEYQVQHNETRVQD